MLWRGDVPIPRLLVACIMLVAALVVAVALAAVSYRASGTLLLGYALVWLAWAVTRLIAHSARDPTWRKRLVGWLLVCAGLSATCLVVLVVIGSYLTLWLSPARPSCPIFVREYTALIQMPDPQTSEFEVYEHAAVSYCEPAAPTDYLDTPPRLITSKDRGLLLKEVAFRPLSGPGLSLVRLDHCVDATVEVRDFPMGSFHAARDATDLTRSPYVDIETVAWSIPDLERGVAFAYVPPPLSRLQPVLAPLIGASSVPQCILGLVAVVGGIALIPALAVVRSELVKAGVSTLKDKLGIKRTEPITTSIVSRTGEEKEKEVDQG